MTQYAQMPDGTHVEFPDDATPAEMAAILNRGGADTGPKANPSEGVSFGQNVREGFGRSLDKSAQGLSQILPQGATDFANAMRGAVGVVPIQDPNEAATYDKPLMATGGGVTGNVLGSVAQMLAPGGAIGKGAQALGVAKSVLPALTGAATAGVFGSTQPTVGDETRASNVGKEALFGAGGGVLGQGVGALARGASQTLTPAVKELAERAGNLGIPISAAQLADSRFVKILQDTLSKLPFTGSGKFYEGQRKAFYGQLAKQMGVQGEDLGEEVMQAARLKSSSMFDDLTARNNLPLTPKVIGSIQEVVQKAAKSPIPENGAVVSRQAQNIVGAADANGVLPGTAYRELDSEIGRNMKSASGDMKHYLGQLRDALRGAMDDAISPADKAAWKQARSEYRARKIIEPTVSKDQVMPSPALIASAIANKTSDMAYGGGGELADIARIAKQFMKTTPDSYTAPRLFAQDLLKAGGAVGGGAYAGIDPFTMLAALAAGKGTSAALNSKLLGKYLQQGLPGAPVIEGVGQTAPYLLPAIYGGQ